MDEISTTDYGKRIRRCYLASIVYCPMTRTERDGDQCMKCRHCAGLVNEAGFAAIECTWHPTVGEVIRPEFRLAA